MTYSSAVFETPDQLLAEAQSSKYERLCRKLQLVSSDHLLEIGTGWGGMALHATRHHGCRVTPITLSEAQATYASQQIRAAGLAERVDIRLEDYRSVTGSYDKICSIEMLEDVGDEFLEPFLLRSTRGSNPTVSSPRSSSRVRIHGTINCGEEWTGFSGISSQDRCWSPSTGSMRRSTEPEHYPFTIFSILGLTMRRLFSSGVFDSTTARRTSAGWTSTRHLFVAGTIISCIAKPASHNEISAWCKPFGHVPITQP